MYALRPAALDPIMSRLVERFAGTFSPESVARCVADSYDELAAAATIHTFLGLFTERFAGERLMASARTEHLIVSDIPEVLFVCIHNAGRSQMAAALLHERAHGAVHVRSAGSEPADRLNPAVVAAMAEVGIDVSQEFPKPLTEEFVRGADVVITMGCGDVCPIFPGKQYLDWQLDDPAGKSIDEVRVIRDDIDRRVQALLAELVAVTSSGTE